MASKHVIHVHIGDALYEKLRAATDASGSSLIGEIRRRLMESFVNAPENNYDTISVPEAGKKFFGLSRNGSYDAAKRGDIPTIRMGKKIRVSVQAVHKMLSDPQRNRRGPR